MIDLDGAKKMKFVLMKEHPLLGYALSFMMGAYLALVVNIPLFLCIIILLISACFVTVLTIKMKSSRFFVLCMFIAIGYLLCNHSIPKWYNEGYVPPEECQITGTVESVKYTGYSYEYILRDVSLGREAISSKVKISNITDSDYIDTGEIIRLRATLEKPAAAQQQGMFSEARYYMTKDIQYVGTIFNSTIKVINKDANLVSVNTKLQGKIYSRLSRDFAQPVSGILYSLTTGDKSYMDSQIYSMCADLGIAHIFAISGLHIGALLVLWELYCQKRKKRFLVKILGSTVLIIMLYLIVGSRASLLRAIAMWALVVIYQYAGIKGDVVDFLSIAMIVLLFINPLYVIDLGFILSVTCVGAIGLIYIPLLKKYKGSKLISFYPVSLFVLSLSILSMSWIITAKSFNQVAIMSPVWNVVFVPLVTVLIALMLCYYVLSYIPVISTVIIFLADNLTKFIVYLVKVFSSINVHISTPNISFVAALALIVVFLLMTDAIIKGRKKIRLLMGVIGIAAIMTLIIFMPKPEKLEVYAGYDASFVYIYEGDKSVLLLNEDDGGIRRVLEDIDEEQIDTFIYAGNDIADLDALLSDATNIEFDEIIVHKDLLDGYTGQNSYSSVDSYDKINIGNVTISLCSFRANKNAIIHYYADIKYYDRHFVYLDPLRLREGAIESSEIVISSRWTKQRIENIIYANPKYVIINSRNYLMDDMPVSKEDMMIPTYNINNSGSFTYFPQGDK